MSVRTMATFYALLTGVGAAWFALNEAPGAVGLATTSLMLFILCLRDVK